MPERDFSGFDSFEWFREPGEVPNGCVVFTDGSLIDGKVRYGCQSLGWAFAIINDDGDLIAAAHGVPPQWISTIQGAELWAVRMAMLHVTFPEKLYTDCMSVKLGVRRSREWAGSSKRRMASVCSVVVDQLDSNCDIVEWMPAHTSKAAIGRTYCSDGQPVCDLKWSSNQLVDLLAKAAAESVRVPSGVRHWLVSRDEQILDLVVFVGKLTHAANSHTRPDGVVLRDAEPMPKGRAKKVSRPRSKVSEPISRKSRPLPRAMAPKDDWIASWQRSCARSGPSMHACGQPSSGVRTRAIRDGISSRQEAAFQSWWRESRSRSLQPRDAATPSASERLEALRSRVRNRQSSADV